jgi:hypothetical protein
MAGVSEIRVSGKKILLVDYSGCKSVDLFQIFDIAKSVIVEANEPRLILTNFSDTFVTSSFVRYAETEAKKVNNLIFKNAFTGI